ncbi:YbaB/EbfC family nucleoid-associated protein [Nocardia sp. NPDC050406]|uniref:YbaB/EbfC family nucleoid-associated protein n=1 Tax=Nocardia sp. NPDC050406 TaxID=3364318 RepID=UPI00379A8456
MWLGWSMSRSRSMRPSRRVGCGPYKEGCVVGSWDELEARVRQRMYRFQELGDELGAVRGRETSADGAVTVEVDGNGALLDLDFSSEISRLSPDEFERTVVDTANAAARNAFAKRAALVTRFNEEIAG